MSIHNHLILAVVYRKGGLGPTGRPVDYSATELDDAKIERMLDRGYLGLRWLLAGVDSADTAAPLPAWQGAHLETHSPGE